MIPVLICVFAVLLIIAAHYLRVVRWTYMIDIYEDSDKRRLLRSLAIGYSVDFFLPFKVGDIFRVLFAGKRMKNGYLFAIATVLIDRIMDVIAIAVILLGVFFGDMLVQGVVSDQIRDAVILYAILIGIIILFAAAVFWFNRGTKRVIAAIAGVFNEKINFVVLKFFWVLITSVKDIFQKVKKAKLILITVFMWGLYFSSYFMLSHFLNLMGVDFGIREIMRVFFMEASNNLLALSAGKYGYILIYLITSIAALWGLSFVVKNKNNEEKLNMMLHRDSGEQLKFLKEYFKGEDRKYFQTYVKFNRDVVIVEDCSAGSNATTLLCLKEGQMFYRKYVYSLKPDIDKLKEQYEWILTHSGQLPLPQIIATYADEMLCYYDMAYDGQYATGFTFLHSVPPETGWETLKLTLGDLEKSLYRNAREAKPEMIAAYIEKKVTRSLEAILNSAVIKPILKYDMLIINGKPYQGLRKLAHLFDPEALAKVFSGDMITPIHGDFTIENIICSKTNPGDYYLIDPNPENIHNSPFLDYAKLLQSLHGSYEFMMKLDSYERYENRITYLADQSVAYGYLYRHYREYLFEKFSLEQVKSIYFHELVHWLRLMPYKIKKNGENALIFFCQLVKVANEIDAEFLGGGE